MSLDAWQDCMSLIVTGYYFCDLALFFSASSFIPC